MTKPCAFCTLAPTRVIAENEFAVGVRDSFPVSPGHTLVIPRCAGDTPDPRGGVRRVLPAKAKYRA
jgi:diadenosine tetraphosphate (Ap4A) HIT family hydrolase